MIPIYTKESCLIIVQVDHLTSESLGSIIGYLYDCGARNVQMIPTVTKKNRPGHLLLIDIAEKDREKIEEIIVFEIGSTGWHCFNTEHRHVGIEIKKVNAKLILLEDTLEYVIEVKINKANPAAFRIEHRSISALKDELMVRGIYVSLESLNRQLSFAIKSTKDNNIELLIKEDKKNG